MSRAFLDTNIVVYYYTLSEPHKREIAASLLIEHDAVISTQVLSELCNVLRKKFAWAWGDIQSIIAELRSTFEIFRLDEATISHALQIAQTINVSYYDSLIIASVIDSNCSTLFSEDFQHNQKVKGIRITNPFEVLKH